MHIVYLIEQIDVIGGIQRSLTARANYLVEHYNYKITIVCTIKNSGIPAFKLHNSINVKFLDPLTSKKTILGRIFLRYKQSLYILKELQPDILITVKFFLHNLFFTLLNKNSKLISEVREPKGLNSFNRKQNLKFIINKHLQNFFLKRQDIVIVLTEEDKKNWGFKNIVVVPNPKTISSNIVSNLLNKQVLAIGRLNKVKGFDKLLDVWYIVNNKHPNWTLKILGEGDEYKNLKNKISKLKLTNCVILDNKFSVVLPEFLNSSIFVLSSQFEAFGNVLVEAKVCGVPAIAFNAPSGPKEIIIQGEDGFLIELNNIKAMAEKIIYLIENEEIRLKMGRNAKINSDKYDLINIIELYNKAITGKTL